MDYLFLGDAILNYSQTFMRHGNGAKMNVPLMICTKLLISEVGGEARNMDFYNPYPDQVY